MLPSWRALGSAAGLLALMLGPTGIKRGDGVGEAILQYRPGWKQDMLARFRGRERTIPAVPLSLRV
eukprot:7816320-Alexandrium_andersonii.AAC.1